MHASLVNPSRMALANDWRGFLRARAGLSVPRPLRMAAELVPLPRARQRGAGVGDRRCCQSRQACWASQYSSCRHHASAADCVHCPRRADALVLVVNAPIKRWARWRASTARRSELDGLGAQCCSHGWLQLQGIVERTTRNPWSHGRRGGGGRSPDDSRSGAPDMSDNETRTGSDVRAGAVASGDGFGSPWQRPCFAKALGLTTSSACLFNHKLC